MEHMEGTVGMESVEAVVSRLALMTESLERTVGGLEDRLREHESAANEVERMVATVESASLAEVEALETRVAEAERQIAVLHASALQAAAQIPAGRRTLGTTVGVQATSLLAKHGMSEGGPVEAGAVDAALASLPVEQRIAVKSQLIRAGLLG